MKNEGIVQLVRISVMVPPKVASKIINLVENGGVELQPNDTVLPKINKGKKNPPVVINDEGQGELVEPDENQTELDLDGGNEEPGDGVPGEDDTGFDGGEPEAPKKPETKVYAKADMVKALQTYAKANGRDEANKLLAKFVPKGKKNSVDNVEPKRYSDLIRLANA